jgi:hypothetical protein
MGRNCGLHIEHRGEVQALTQAAQKHCGKRQIGRTSGRRSSRTRCSIPFMFRDIWISVLSGPTGSQSELSSIPVSSSVCRWSLGFPRWWLPASDCCRCFIGDCPSCNQSLDAC